ncbi:2-amino-4-hydroxy-6-hydroxymethyldihydropteridine diphosphokinase [Desulfovibrio sp. OttesenSCG-928-C06]|nr:2-amino-4-hydroxy-6-hydroxymethyldihydropteridine diphosphokinase [Desulfovibrio sp. OttesenSCG-928-C06]
MPKSITTGAAAYIGLGSNSGESLQNLNTALDAIKTITGVRLLAVSQVYRTEPQGDADQPWFFNQAAKLALNIKPHELLKELQKIENNMGRERDPQRRFGPRTIDLDILHVDGAKLDTPELTLPHPRMWERAFVLVPLLDVAGEEFGKQMEAALSRLDYRLDNDKIYQKG